MLRLDSVKPTRGYRINEIEGCYVGVNLGLCEPNAISVQNLRRSSFVFARRIHVALGQKALPVFGFAPQLRNNRTATQPDRTLFEELWKRQFLDKYECRRDIILKDVTFPQNGLPQRLRVLVPLIQYLSNRSTRIAFC
jgi:hypothetical protein